MPCAGMMLSMTGASVVQERGPQQIYKIFHGKVDWQGLSWANMLWGVIVWHVPLALRSLQHYINGVILTIGTTIFKNV